MFSDWFDLGRSCAEVEQRDLILDAMLSCASTASDDQL
jgi:hypothetical protein